MSSPEIRLVVNADDFGMSPAVSRGILRAHREGIVTSTSLLGNCDDMAGPCALLAEAPGLGVGIHLSLVGGRPVAAAHAVRTLTDAQGAFLPRVQDLLMPLLRGRLDVAEIELEFEAQIARAREAGIVPDHLNTHRHLGFAPSVGRALEAVARRNGIPGVRSAVERPTLSWVADPRRGLEAGVLAGFAWLTRRQMGTLRHGPQSWGYMESGRLDEIRILEIIGRLGPGAHELICHPGEEDDAAIAQNEPEHYRIQELQALASPKVRRALERRGVELCRWRDLF